MTFSANSIAAAANTKPYILRLLRQLARGAKVICFLLGVVVIRCAHADAILDQYFVGTNDLAFNIKEGFDFVGQSFTAGITGQLTEVRVDVFDATVSATPNLRISVFDTAGGVPNSTVLGSVTLSTDHSSIGNSVVFSTPISIIAGRSYLLAVDYPYVAPGPGQGQGTWAGQNANGYAGGAIFAGNYINPTTVSWTSFQAQDLFFQTYVLGLLGDYNGNSVVDAADYVVWRKNLNTSVQLPNDETAGVTASDYGVWRDHFGNVVFDPCPGGGACVGSGSSEDSMSESRDSSSPAFVQEAVPEPTTSLLLMYVAAYLCHKRAMFDTCRRKSVPHDRV